MTTPVDVRQPDALPWTPGQIRHKLKQVIYRHLQKEIRDAFKVTPEGCAYNQPISLKDLGKVHICQYRDDNKPRRTICDSRTWNGVEQARLCPLWTPLRDKEAIKADFKALITSGDRGRIAARFPDVAALMWVVDGVDLATDVPWDEMSNELEAETVTLGVPDE